MVEEEVGAIGSDLEEPDRNPDAPPLDLDLEGIREVASQLASRVEGRGLGGGGPGRDGAGGVRIAGKEKGVVSRPSSGPLHGQGHLRAQGHHRAVQGADALHLEPEGAGR
jgi:hypothetical protein